MPFQRIPIVQAGVKSIHADGLMVTATDSSVGMYFTFDDVDAMKVAADFERSQQRREGRRGLEVVR
jgi:hypothetical protein